MKRYWKLMTLATFILVIIGTLFIQTSLATTDFPEFIIEHESGDQTEAERLTIIGDYVVDERTYIQAEISDEGTSYRNNESSYLYGLKDEYLHPEVKRLQKDYRNFIRGKHQGQISSFFEDQNMLAYVELKTEYLSTRDGRWNYSFVVDVLDKKTKNSTSFELVIPEDEKYNYLNIQGVQFINDELKIITVNELNINTDQSHHTEMHIYTVNLDTKEIVNDEVIDFTIGPIDDDQWMNIYTIDNGKDSGPKKYILSTIEVTKETYTNDGHHHYGVTEQQLIAYNLETNEQVRVELPEEYSEELYPILSSGSMVYFGKKMANQFEMIGYNLENQAIETTHIFDMPHTEGELFNQFLFMNNKIYIVQQLAEGKVDSSILIGDIQTGEILYEGLVKLTSSSKDQQAKEMHINEMRVKKE